MQVSRVEPQRFDPRQHVQLAKTAGSKVQQNVPIDTQLNIRQNSLPTGVARITNATVNAPTQAQLTLESDNNTAATTAPPLNKPFGRFGYPKMIAAERDGGSTTMDDKQEDDVESEPELSKSTGEELLEESPEKNSYSPSLINHWRRVARVRRLKDAYDGKSRITFNDMENDPDLMTAFIDNMDYFEADADGVLCRKVECKKTSKDIDWRFQNYATFTDLKHFALKEPWPQIAIPITLVEPQYILCLKTDCPYDARLRIHELTKQFIHDGGKLTVTKCTYGSTMLIEESDENEYLRVVALSYDQMEDSWLVAPIDSTFGPPAKVLMKVRPDSLYELPNVVSLQAIPGAIFTARLRGLNGVKPGAIDLARSYLYTDVILTVTLNERSCIVLPFYLEVSEGECPIDLMLIDENNDGAVEGQLVSEILYCKSLGIPIGPIELVDDHPFWIGERGVVLPRPNLKRIVQELEEMEREEREDSQDLGSQRSLSLSSSSAGPSTKESFLIENSMHSGEKTTQQQPAMSSESMAERKAVVFPGTIEQLIRSYLAEPCYKVMFRSMLTMLQGTSNVSKAELDYIITQFCK